MRPVYKLVRNRSWSEEPWLDHLLSGTLLATHIIVINIAGIGDVLAWADKSHRLTVYSTGASVISILGGLGAISTTIYVAATGERARKVREQYPHELKRNWTHLLVDLGISAGACVVAQTLDADRDPHSARFVFEYAFTLAALSFVRLVWLFNRMISIADRDITDKRVEEAPELNPVWKSKLTPERKGESNNI
jgi:hypothetical protein